MKLKAPFSIKYQKNQFFKQAGIKVPPMSQMQADEMEKAFYGACGQMMVLLRDELPKLPEEEAIFTLQTMLEEVVTFWKEKSRDYVKSKK